MQEQVKIIKGITLDGTEEEFKILVKSNLGSGSFGQVKKAIWTKWPNRYYAAKIIKYEGDKTKRQTIEKQIQILKLLPDHPNIVKILPFKCFSQNNFYIFMELCEDGTLSDYFKKNIRINNEQIVNIFYQLMMGYKVLWNQKIIHHDIKLQNILIKKGLFKITDFGFSILQQKYIQSTKRNGTQLYMSYQKLTQLDYVANQLTDVYALGVCMFKLMTRKHPYVNTNEYNNNREFTSHFKNNNMFLPKIITTYSQEMYELYKIVTKMCAKSAKQRITCEQIYNFIQNSPLFKNCQNQIIQKTQQIKLLDLGCKITEASQAIFIPFQVQLDKQSKYLSQLQQAKKLNEQLKKSIQLISQWIFSKRLLIQFYDKIARRLDVQKQKNIINQKKTFIFNKVILNCFLYEKRLAKSVIDQIKNPKKFKNQEINMFKNSTQSNRLYNMILNDEKQIMRNQTDHNKQNSNGTTLQQKKMLKDLTQISQNNNLSLLQNVLKQNLRQCIEIKSLNISSKIQLITLKYLCDGIQFIDRKWQGCQLQQYFYNTQLSKTTEILEQIQQFFLKINIDLPIFEVSQKQQNSNDYWI